MRLLELWINEFKNLKDFRIDLNEKNPVTVLIGWNGTGKSNLFEALATIFRDLELGTETLFAYKLKYACKGMQVRIDYDPARPKKNRLKKDFNDSNDRVASSSFKEFLPSHIFGYYSGDNDRLQGIFQAHKKQHYDVVVRTTERYDIAKVEEHKSIRYMFYAETIHSKFALLAFFYKRSNKMKTLMEEYFRIIDLESVLFVMKKPSWATKEKAKKHLWEAKGLVRDFMDKLYEISLAPMKLKQRVPTTIKKSKTEDFYYFYIKDLDSLLELASMYQSQNEFFTSIESTFLSEVIHDIIIKVKVWDDNNSFTYKEMSEGEQQLLLLIGLLRFTKEEESLILLDEPDTHLNPIWSINYLDILDEFVKDEAQSNNQKKETRHLIMATHDPLVIAGLDKNKIQIFKQDKDSDHSLVGPPETSPIGMGFSAILTSDMFGFRSDLDSKTLARLDRKTFLIGKDKLNKEEKNELKLINEKLDKVGLLQTFSDPYYTEYIKGLSRKNALSKFQKQFLTKEDREEQERITDEILEELDKEESSE